jgi:hypothetical protein
MIIDSSKIAHYPPWRYTIMVRKIGYAPAYIRIGSTDTFKMSSKRHHLAVDGYWSQASGGSRYGGKRYKTIQSALQALSDIKKAKHIYDARIHHLYYHEGAKQIRYQY